MKSCETKGRTDPVLPFLLGSGLIRHLVWRTVALNVIKFNGPSAEGFRSLEEDRQTDKKDAKQQTMGLGAAHQPLWISVSPGKVLMEDINGSQPWLSFRSTLGSFERTPMP